MKVFLTIVSALLLWLLVACSRSQRLPDQADPPATTRAAANDVAETGNLATPRSLIPPSVPVDVTRIQPTLVPSPTNQPSLSPPTAPTTQSQSAPAEPLHAAIERFERFFEDPEQRSSGRGRLDQLERRSQGQVLLELTESSLSVDFNWRTNSYALVMQIRHEPDTEKNEHFEQRYINRTAYVRRTTAHNNRWYVEPSSAQFDPLYGRYMVIELLYDSAMLASYVRLHEEDLDNLRCDVYTSAPHARDILRRQLSHVPFTEERFEISKAEAKLWVCEDGYPHQLVVETIVLDKERSDERRESRILVHFFDFGADIHITPPAEAIPAPTPLPGLDPP